MLNIALGNALLNEAVDHQQIDQADYVVKLVKPWKRRKLLVKPAFSSQLSKPSAVQSPSHRGSEIEKISSFTSQIDTSANDAQKRISTPKDTSWLPNHSHTSFKAPLKKGSVLSDSRCMPHMGVSAKALFHGESGPSHAGSGCKMETRESSPGKTACKSFPVSRLTACCISLTEAIDANKEEAVSSLQTPSHLSTMNGHDSAMKLSQESDSQPREQVRGEMPQNCTLQPHYQDETKTNEAELQMRAPATKSATGSPVLTAAGPSDSPKLDIPPVMAIHPLKDLQGSNKDLIDLKFQRLRTTSTRRSSKKDLIPPAEGGRAPLEDELQDWDLAGLDEGSESFCGAEQLIVWDPAYALGIFSLVCTIYASFLRSECLQQIKWPLGYWLLDYHCNKRITSDPPPACFWK